jgi:hypothetical protein
MLRDPLLACEGNRGRYTVTVSPPAGRRSVNPRAPQYRGQSEVVRVAIGLVTVQVAQTVAAYEAQVSSRFSA